MPKLLVKHPERGDQVFALTSETVTVGRRADNQIQINHSTVSGHHAEFVSVNGHYVFRDLESTNHSFVDGMLVTEADLTRQCIVTIGSIECEYVPDPGEATPEFTAPPAVNMDSLRKTISGLRHQNDDLLGRVAEQQKQIDILGSARLLTPATGADIASLRSQVKNLTAERDKLSSENSGLRSEIDRLRGLVATQGDSMKATVQLTLSPAQAAAAPAISVAPDGAATVPAPVAKVAANDPNASTCQLLAEINDKLRTLSTQLTKTPDDTGLRAEMAVLTAKLNERASVLGGHPAARLATALDAVMRDILHRPGPLDSGLVHTLSQASEFFAALIFPAVFGRCASLPAPSILVVDDDKDLLPAVVASFEFSRLATTGCGDAREALELLQKHPFDLILLDVQLPGASGIDACASIRALPAHARTPIVFLTGDDNLATRAQGVANGATDFIGKPFNMFELTLKALTWVFRHQVGLGV